MLDFIGIFETVFENLVDAGLIGVQRLQVIQLLLVLDELILLFDSFLQIGLPDFEKALLPVQNDKSLRVVDESNKMLGPHKRSYLFMILIAWLIVQSY